MNIVNLLIKKISSFFVHAYVSLADPEGGLWGLQPLFKFQQIEKKCIESCRTNKKRRKDKRE